MKLVNIFLAAILCLIVAACGGGGGSPGATSTGGGSTTSTVADFYFQLDKVTIDNSGTDEALLSVTAVDVNRNVVSSAPVSVAVDSYGVFSPSGGNATNASGVYTGLIKIGSDKSNRTINATITVNGISKVASVTVVGGQISVTPVPATPAPEQTVTMNISVADSAGVAIPNANLTLSGSLGLSGTVQTDLSGAKSVSFLAPKTSGTYTFVVSGLGMSTTKVVQVVSPGSSTIPDAVGTVSSVVLQPQPTSISPNASGSTVNRSKLSAKFINSSNAGIENMRVRFQIVPPALGSGELISTGDATVYSDASGEAVSYYIAGTRSSPTNGVKVRICYKATDFVSSDFDASGTCLLSTQVDANLTVASTPLAISISTDNTMAKGLGGIAYVKQFLVQVNDSSGVAVKGAVVSASVDITHYGKGAFGYYYPYAVSTGYPFVPIPTASPKITASLAMTAGGIVTATAANTVVPGTVTYGGQTLPRNVWCANEDTNRNGFLDAGEDVDGDGVISPAKSEIIISYVNGNTTDANGQLLLQVTYGQNVGSWLAYTVRATTSVAGSAGDASKNFVTEVLEGDVDNGSFLTPPFGSGSCVQQN